MDTRADRREFLRQASAAGLGGAAGVLSIAQAAQAGERTLRVGAAQVDITPQKFPVLVCGGFLSRSATGVNDPLFARCLVFDDGARRIVLMVADTIAIPYEMNESVKQAASRATGIPVQNMLISATHTHSGGSVTSALGTKADSAYCEFLPGKLVECIQKAAANLRPARVGWAGENHPEGTHCRVFIRRPDCIDLDPMGRRTVRAMMHPGYQNPLYIGPCGPSDPEVSVLAVQSLDGKPMALLANYSMHYFGAPPISADYYGDFVRIVSERLAPDDPSFVAMMSHGTSGDQQWQDYARPQKPINRQQYATAVADAAMRAYRRIEFHDSVPLGMAERRLTIRLQQPDRETQAWAEKTMAEMNGRDPRTRPEVYAREVTLLKDRHTAERKLQVIRIGDLGIAALPAEVYAISGLKLKLQCPLGRMFNIELANGSIGYIPPPELRPLGGYNTWPARHTATAPDTETIIVESLLAMFEELTGRARRPITLGRGPLAETTLARRPMAYWRMGEIEGHRAIDASGNGRHGVYEPGYALYLDGPDRSDLRAAGDKPRAVQFAGGRMKAALDLGADYTLEMFFWNGLPNDNRGITGHLFSAAGDHLGIGGTDAGKEGVGRLFFSSGQKGQTLAGGPVVEPKTWHHMRLVRRGQEVAVYLDFGAQPILSGRVPALPSTGSNDVFLGGGADNLANFEGRLAEVAIWNS